MAGAAKPLLPLSAGAAHIAVVGPQAEVQECVLIYMHMHIHMHIHKSKHTQARYTRLYIRRLRSTCLYTRHCTFLHADAYTRLQMCLCACLSICPYICLYTSLCAWLHTGLHPYFGSVYAYIVQCRVCVQKLDICLRTHSCICLYTQLYTHLCTRLCTCLQTRVKRVPCYAYCITIYRVLCYNDTQGCMLPHASHTMI